MAKRYVQHWEEFKKDSTGLLLWGNVGTGKSFIAGCIANALLDKGVPVMITNFARLLNKLTDMYAGVVCMDIERLSRGSSLESGHIMQVLQLNNCNIITPGKTYDLQNDSDEQFTDMKFMFSRYDRLPTSSITKYIWVKSAGAENL